MKPMSATTETTHTNAHANANANAINTSSRRPLTPDQKTPHRTSGRGWLHTRLSLPQARHTSLALHAESIPTPHLRHTLPTNLACLPACQPTTPWANNGINHCGSMHQILRLKDSPEAKGLWTGRTEYQNTRRSVPRRQPLTTAHICLPIHPTTQGKKNTLSACIGQSEALRTRLKCRHWKTYIAVDVQPEYTQWPVRHAEDLDLLQSGYRLRILSSIQRPPMSSGFFSKTPWRNTTKCSESMTGDCPCYPFTKSVHSTELGARHSVL